MKTKIKTKLSKDVFEGRRSAGSGRFAFLGSELAHILGQIVSASKDTRQYKFGGVKAY